MLSPTEDVQPMEMSRQLTEWARTPEEFDSVIDQLGRHGGRPYEIKYKEKGYKKGFCAVFVED